VAVRINMIRKILYTALFAALFAVVLGSCLSNKSVNSAGNSRNSLDWKGVYAGLIPAADCPGIDVQIILRPDQTYEIRYEYLDRENSLFTDKGKFSWDRTGNIITLDTGNFSPHYRVSEQFLVQLDMNRKEITGALADNYKLKKMY